MLEQGRRLVLHVDGNMACERVLQLVGAYESFLCCDSLDEAVAFAGEHSGAAARQDLHRLSSR